mgnify:CR=1 FL=1
MEKFGRCITSLKDTVFNSRLQPTIKAKNVSKRGSEIENEILLKCRSEILEGNLEDIKLYEIVRENLASKLKGLPDFFESPTIADRSNRRRIFKKGFNRFVLEPTTFLGSKLFAMD